MNTTKEVGFETTPSELLRGDVNPALEETGLLGCQMEVVSTETEAGHEYSVDLDVEPFDSAGFVSLLNIVAPSERQQYHFGIVGDWLLAKDPNSDLYKMHERIGRPWDEFLLHADSLIDVGRSHYENMWGGNIRDIEHHDEWESSLPVPVPFDNERFRGAYDMNTNQLFRMLESAGLKDPGSVLLSIIHEAAGIFEARKNAKFKLNDAPEYLRTIESMTKILREPNDHRVLRAFAKLPKAQRRLIQGNMLAVMTGDENMIPAIVEDWGGRNTYVQHIIGLDYKKEPTHTHKQVIDRQGRPANISYGYRSGFFSSDVPYDYRKLDDAAISTVSDYSGYYEADALVIDTSNPKIRYYGKPNKVFIDSRTIRQIRDARISPRVSWQDVPRASGSVRTDWDLGLTQHGETIGQMDRVVYDSGLLGLIVAAGLSSDVPRMGKVWKPEKGLPGDKNEPSQRDVQQEMGAAQLPLLALMQKHHIAQGNFAQRIREKVAHLS